MKQEERLFAALNNVDDQLLERSERPWKRRSWPAVIGVLAACAAVLAAVCLPQPGRQDGNKPIQTLSFTGGEVGDLHLCSIQYGPKPNASFAIYVNENIYTTTEKDGIYTIRPIEALPEGFPPIDLTISHMEGRWNKAAAMEQVTRELSEIYAQVSEVEETESTISRSASDGTDWNDAQVDVLCVDDGYGGSFVLIARYFTEAAEGHGVRFRDMMNTFTVVYEGFTTSPAWVGELQAAVERLTEAIFSDRMDSVSDLLAEDAEVDGYGRDVSGDISVTAIDYTPDDSQAPASAIVSVKHTINLEDSCNYLTMELTYDGSRWLLAWAGLEK
ncbi:hypothetical protein [uncultured Dysosmobacter sp.]|uniref:hypothetical protein n=1 Tax=uncultured Dysosmobacter sp. TaxID=2591384 RepID=UPI00262C29A2|nr:hypothetical protein [uncultured Dysosmobacter sp.]